MSEKTKRTELLDSLTVLKLALASTKSLMEQVQHILFLDDMVATFNGETMISMPSPVSGVECAVEADPLLSLLGKTDADMLTIHQTDKELRIEGNKFKSGLVYEEIKNEKQLPMPSSKGVWKKLPKDFVQALRLTIPCISTDASIPALTCLKLEGEEITATDEFRITRAKCSGKLPSCLIFGRSLESLLSLKPLQYQEAGSWIHFLCADEVVFSCGTVKSEYPKLFKVFDVEGQTVKLPKHLPEIIERARVVSKTDLLQDERIELEIHGEELIVKAEGQRGWFEESTEVKAKKDCSLIINPFFLLEALELGCSVIIGKDKVKLEGEGFEHVVSLVWKRGNNNGPVQD